MCVAGNLTQSDGGSALRTLPPKLTATCPEPGGNRKRLSFFFWRPINITTTKVGSPEGNIYNNHIIWGGSRMTSKVNKNSSPGQGERGRGITGPVLSSPGKIIGQPLGDKVCSR